jgi:hypothetical protein
MIEHGRRRGNLQPVDDGRIAMKDNVSHAVGYDAALMRQDHFGRGPQLNGHTAECGPVPAARQEPSCCCQATSRFFAQSLRLGFRHRATGGSYRRPPLSTNLAATAAS